MNGSFAMTMGWNIIGAFKAERSTACSATIGGETASGSWAIQSSAQREYFEPSIPMITFISNPHRTPSRLTHRIETLEGVLSSERQINRVLYRCCLGVRTFHTGGVLLTPAIFFRHR
jgi:hypothetical protein